MEVRGQDKVIGMPTTLGYNPPNRDSSSSKLSSSPALPSTANNIIFINPLQTLDPHPSPHRHQPHQLNLSPHKSSRRDSEQNPDPISSPIVVTPSATTTTATSIPGGSNFKAPPAQPPPPQKVRYRECLRNHAASSGGHVLDGCGEFMPSGEEDIPEALKCAACECHRNFHRKEIEGDHLPNNYYVVNHQKHTISRRDSETRVFQLPPPPLPPVHHSAAGGPVPQTMMAFGGRGGGGGGADESSSEDLNMNNLFRATYAAGQQAAGSKKRFRTKFSQEQKEKMMEVAEKLGWKIQRHDEQEVQKLCSEVGIKRQVFKVWMHNNKQAMKKKQMLEG
ncbi:hypothetical protein PRUPE_7G155700 [Prunus persica]|uniref:ZF-HD dimerization-type domain-containing protein n=1 Tax=Prunus persica TaxID=3760 RepID=A0A251NEX7_PRUPE|nr:hypothetical protein PRUPE_7G155700 [Prunus persica]